MSSYLQYCIQFFQGCSGGQGHKARGSSSNRSDRGRCGPTGPLPKTSTERKNHRNEFLIREFLPTYSRALWCPPLLCCFRLRRNPKERSNHGGPPYGVHPPGPTAKLVHPPPIPASQALCRARWLCRQVPGGRTLIISQYSPFSLCSPKAFSLGFQFLTIGGQQHRA